MEAQEGGGGRRGGGGGGNKTGFGFSPLPFFFRAIAVKWSVFLLRIQRSRSTSQFLCRRRWPFSPFYNSPPPIHATESVSPPPRFRPQGGISPCYSVSSSVSFVGTYFPLLMCKYGYFLTSYAHFPPPILCFVRLSPSLLSIPTRNNYISIFRNYDCQGEIQMLKIFFPANIVLRADFCLSLLTDRLEM